MTGKRNARGWRIGEWHGRAKWSDDKIREIRAEYRPRVRGHGIDALAAKHGMPQSTIRDIVTYATRWAA